MAVVVASAKQASILVTLGVFFHLSIDLVYYFKIASKSLLKMSIYTKSFKDVDVLFDEVE